MTARDTHEMRLASWPRLATFPTTNGLIALVMLLWFLTGFAALIDATVASWWPNSLEMFTGIVVAQFVGKRLTHKPDGNGSAPAATP